MVAGAKWGDFEMTNKQRASALIVGVITLLFVVLLPLRADAKRQIFIEGMDSVPPLSFYDGQGKPSGFNVELIGTAMERLGYNYTIKLSNTDSVVSRYNRGLVDMVLGLEGRGVDPTKRHQSNITLLMYLCIASRKEDNYSSIADLRGKTVALVKDSRTEVYMRNDSLFDSHIVYFTNPERAIKELAAGKYDAIVSAQFIASYVIEDNGIDNVVLRPMNTPPLEQRMAGRDCALVMEVTDEINRMRHDGTYDRIYDKWLGEKDLYQRYFYILMSVAVLGLLVVVYVISRMVLNLRRSRQLLRKERHRLSMLMYAGSFESFEMDLQTMEFYRISPMGEVLSRMTIDEMLDRVYHKDRQIVRDNIDKVRSGKRYGEVVVRVKSGTDSHVGTPGYRYCVLYSRELKDGDGNVKLYWLLKDVNDSYVNRIELMRYHERMDMALRNTGISQFDYDVVRKLVTWRNGYKLNGEVTVGVNTYLEYMPAFKPIFDLMDEAQVGEFSRNITFCYPDSEDVHYATVMARVMARADNGDVVLYTGIRQDNTSLVRIQHDLEQAKEKAEAADRLKSQFLDNMSHEIRTPLNAIVGFSSMLQDATDEEQKQYIEIINNGSEQLLSLINDILDMSSIEAGTFELHPFTFDIADSVNGFVAEIRRKMKPGVQLVVDNPYKSCIVTLDERMVAKIIKVFMTNAIKNTEQGYVKLSYVYNEERGLTISVEDTGVGIAEENFDKVFRRFVKIDTFVQGSGLELAILKALADRMGDDVGFKSEKGVGSTFFYTIHCKANVTAK